MKTKIIDGKSIGEDIRSNLSARVQSLMDQGHRPPSLSVVLVGDDPASQVYVNHKEQACGKVGIISRSYRLPASTSEADVLAVVKDLNADPDVDGILVQLPLPAHMNKFTIINAIDPLKDVDGLTPYNQGLLAWNLPGHRPCTPAGILRLIRSRETDLTGKRAVVVGRSILVGLPVATLLTHAGATVTTVHSKTTHPQSIAKEAEILVVAAGVPGLVDQDWVKEGSIVIDVGIHRTPNGLVGDVQFDQVFETVTAITPVPGGVGPMTIAMLLSNCLDAYGHRARTSA
jgi:methylenetetrahydrofolate dehydrogenase (NADP+)/methenyltetrahydrofolate cyclohydrolase